MHNKDRNRAEGNANAMKGLIIAGRARTFRDEHIMFVDLIDGLSALGNSIEEQQTQIDGIQSQIDNIKTDIIRIKEAIDRIERTL